MPEHNKIAAQAVQWINKCGGFIFFKKEVSKPCKSISAKRNNDEPKPFAANDPRNNTNQYQKCSGKMQPAANRIFVLCQIVWIKTRKGFIFFVRNEMF